MADVMDVIPGYGDDDILLHLGYPSSHFTAKAGQLLGQAAQAIAVSINIIKLYVILMVKVG